MARTYSIRFLGRGRWGVWTRADKYEVQHGPIAEFISKETARAWVARKRAEDRRRNPSLRTLKLHSLRRRVVAKIKLNPRDKRGRFVKRKRARR